ncbi:MAG: protein kinase [bacterium]|jgi:tRNA A-37 threonylcarbamoyl transferase component Bud32|nr:serine/threonine protein kinase [Planctomycetota bacterium]HIL52980.1 serine/threonine protein kinase [Planctomycetota bacterium]
MSREPGEARDLHEHLAHVFLQDVGLKKNEPATPAALDDEEFARIALDLDLLSETDLARVREQAGDDSGLRLWEQLERAGSLDVGDVLSVFRFHSELCSHSNRTVGRYYVVERLGEGASGRVYRAIHQDLLKHVALKIMTVHENAPRSMVERFRREAATAAGLRHPSIVGVHDVGVDNDLHYIAMDLVEGETLSEWLAKKPSLEKRLAVLEQSTRAIGYAHSEGVLHRDIKPQNILVRNDGLPIVVDFGLARTTTDATLTRDGAVLGTPQYMAPEQLRGEVTSLTPAADVYALGLVIYEAIVGERLFNQSDAGWPVVPEGQVRFSSEAAALLGKGLCAVCQKCLDPEARYRYSDANEVADELTRVRGGVSVHARPLGLLSALGRGVRRRSTTVASLGFVALFLVLAGGVGRRLLAENRRLEYAGEVKSAYTVLRTRLEPLLAEAESLRYAVADGPEREALLVRAQAATDSFDDETGVAPAYLAWIHFLVREPGAPANLVAVREAHPDNPFPALVCAWSHLRRYADAARWPADDNTLLHAVPRVMGPDTFTETAEMKGLLGEALVELERARASEIWQRVPELRWVEDLGLGFAAYAGGDFAAAIAHLERVGAYNDLPFEPSLILSFANLRTGDLEAAFEAIEPLVKRRPGHVTAARALASCYKRRAILAQREYGGGLGDLSEARRLMRQISTDPERDEALAKLELSIGLVRVQVGEDASGEFERAMVVFERGLEENPTSIDCLGGLAQCLMNLGGEDHMARARELADAMIEQRPGDATAHELGIGVSLVALKEARGKRSIGAADLEAVARRLTQAEERVGAQPTLLYYAVNLELLRADLAARRGEDYGPYMQTAAEAARQLCRDAPEFHRAHFLAWWTSSYLKDLRRPSPSELYEETILLRAPFVSRGQRSPFDVQVAQRMEQLAGSYDSRDDKMRFIVYAYGLLKRQAEEDPERAEWHEKCARLAGKAAGLDVVGAGPWTLEAFEHALRVAEFSGKSGAWSTAVSLGVMAFVHGQDQVLAVALDASGRALVGAEEEYGVRFWIAWLARASGDEARALAELAELRARPLAAELLESHARAANGFLWPIARVADLPRETYRRALVGLDMLGSLDEAHGAALNTRGVLEVRLERWESARHHLLQSKQQNTSPGGLAHPADLAFLALCAQALGEGDEARRLRADLETSMRGWGLEEDPEAQGFLAEVDAVLEGE